MERQLVIGPTREDFNQVNEFFGIVDRILLSPDTTAIITALNRKPTAITSGHAAVSKEINDCPYRSALNQWQHTTE